MTARDHRPTRGCCWQIPAFAWVVVPDGGLSAGRALNTMSWRVTA